MNIEVLIQIAEVLGVVGIFSAIITIGFVLRKIFTLKRHVEATNSNEYVEKIVFVSVSKKELNYPSDIDIRKPKVTQVKPQARNIYKETFTLFEKNDAYTLCDN